MKLTVTQLKTLQRLIIVALDNTHDKRDFIPTALTSEVVMDVMKV